MQIYSDDVTEDCTDDIKLQSGHLRHFAKEAQFTGDYKQASQYYQEVNISITTAGQNGNVDTDD